MRTYQLFGWSRYFPHFIDPDDYLVHKHPPLAGVAQSVSHFTMGWTSKVFLFDSRQGQLIFLQSAHHLPGPTSFLCNGYEDLSPGRWRKRPGRGADHSPSTAELRISGAIPHAPTTFFLSWFWRILSTASVPTWRLTFIYLPSTTTSSKRHLPCFRTLMRATSPRNFSPRFAELNGKF